ncbi:MAG TPA: glycosyltransferase family 2 protein [Candidatus Acidoferrum sp.]|nr:glycosyltransferase family 2 protein [Candidatus Acidoferrum sp.]
MSSVSVYIPAYNAAEFLARSIEGLLAQTRAPDEILVIDDGSADETASIASRFPQVKLIRHEYNRGLGAVRNTAFRSTRNEFVASIDADCVADPAWLANLLTHLEDPKVAAVGGRLIEGVQRSIADRWRAAHMPQNWGASFVRNPKFLFGCNNLFRKSVVLEVGGYDENMRTNGEDTGICEQLRLHGWQYVYEPAALATHLRYDTIPSILETYWRWWKFGVNAYANGVRLRSVIGHALFVHFRYTFLELLADDLRARRLGLLPMDFLALAYLPYRDFRLWLAARSAPPEPRSASEA